MADPTIPEQPLETIDPSTGFQPQQLPSPQPAASAPQAGNVNPDAFSSAPAQVGGPAPQVQQAPEPPVPFWKRILMGAFAGMANSAGAHNWGQALGQGAGGAMKQEQQVFQNQQQQANTQSQIRFRDAQDAYNAAMLHVQQGHLDLAQGDFRRKLQADADKRAEDMQNVYGATVHPIPVGPAGSGPATAFLNQASAAPGGAEVNPWTIAGPDQMYAVSFDGEQGPVKRYQVYADAAKSFKLPVVDRQMVMSLPRQAQMQLEQLPSQFLNGNDRNGKPYTKANEGQLRSDINEAQSTIKELSTDPDTNAQALSNWQTRLNHLNSQLSGFNQAADANTERQIRVAGARGVANNMSRVVDAVDNTGTLRPMTNAERLKTGAVAAAPAMKAGSAQAQINDIVTGSQAARQAVKNVTPLSIAQVGELSQIMNHDSDPTVRHDMLNAFLNKNTLSESQKDFVVALNQLNERALSLRNVAGMGQASDQLRSAIRATLPSAASGDKSLMLKQLDAFDQQVQQLRGGIAKVPGLAGNTGVQVFNVGGTTYHIPADKVAEFKRDHGIR